MINSLIIAALFFVQGPATGLGRAGAIEGRLLSADGKPADGVFVAAVPGDPAPVPLRPDFAVPGLDSEEGNLDFEYLKVDESPGAIRILQV